MLADLAVNLVASLIFWLVEPGLNAGLHKLTGQKQAELKRTLEPAFRTMLRAMESDLHSKIGDIGAANEQALNQVLVDFFKQPAVQCAVWEVAVNRQPFDLLRMQTPWLTVQGKSRLGDLPFDLELALRELEGGLVEHFDSALDSFGSDLSTRVMLAIQRDIQQRQIDLEPLVRDIHQGVNEMRRQGAPVDLGRTPKSLWRVPFPRNESFVGREEDLRSLHAALTESSTVGIRPAGLTGMGGIGKTQLAVEYCYRYQGQLSWRRVLA